MVPPLHSRQIPLPTFSLLYTTKVVYIHVGVHTQMCRHPSTHKPTTTHCDHDVCAICVQTKNRMKKNIECAVCLEERPVFWSCVCAPGRVCKSCYSHPLYDTRKCPTCRRSVCSVCNSCYIPPLYDTTGICPTCRQSDVDIILKQKYDVRLKWFLIFIYTIFAGIYVFLFAFVCYMLYTHDLGIYMCFSSMFLLLVYIE